MNDGWEFYVSLEEHPPRLMMRRKVNGQWEVRKPTQAEAEKYMDEEAW